MEISDDDTEDDLVNSKNDEIEYISSDEDEDDASSKSWLHIGKYHLKSDEKAIMLSKDMWLNDVIINAAQHLITKKYPHVGGFQDTILQRNLSFTVQNGEFVQILNKGGNHWVTITNIGVTDMSTIRIYDSLGGKRFDHCMQKEIASLLHSNSPEITLKLEDVQNQQDGHSCGLFAIAFAVSLCHEEDPRRLTFDRSAMRKHLLNCLTKGEITPFPRKSEGREPNMGRLVTFSIHCTCRLPFDADDVWMAFTCCLCNNMYHRECEAGKKVTIRVEGKDKWICSNCSKESHITESYEIKNHNFIESTVSKIDV